MKTTAIILFVLYLAAANDAAATNKKRCKPPAKASLVATKGKADLTCAVKKREVTITLTGNLAIYRYGLDLPPADPGYVCLVTKSGGWRAEPPLCRPYRDDPRQKYVFGPIVIGGKDERDFAFIFRHWNNEYRVNSATMMSATGPCVASGDTGVGFDQFAITAP